jgi:hypothetical protein
LQPQSSHYSWAIGKEINLKKDARQLFIEEFKKNAHDPKALAECVRQLLLQDNTIKAPSKKGGEGESVINVTSDILKSLKGG